MDFSEPPLLSDAEETHQITALLGAWQAGDEEALGRLIPRVYHRLGRIAGSLVQNEGREEALQATALVHEAFLRMVELERIDWQGRSHFYSMCARLMRRVLVDRARKAGRQKRAGWGSRVNTTELKLISPQRPPDFVALDEALSELAKLDPEMAQVVELRFFCGLEREALGEILGMSSATVTRRWRAARAWLLDRLEQGEP